MCLISIQILFSFSPAAHPLPLSFFSKCSSSTNYLPGTMLGMITPRGCPSLAEQVLYRESCTPASLSRMSQGVSSPCFHEGPRASREHSDELGRERWGCSNIRKGFHKGSEIYAEICQMRTFQR